MVFKRGTFIKSLTSYNPFTWETTVDISVKKIERMHYEITAYYNYPTKFIILSQNFREFINRESKEFKTAMTEFKVEFFRIEDIVNKIKEEYRGYNRRALLISIPIGFFISLILFFFLGNIIPTFLYGIIVIITFFIVYLKQVKK